MSTLSLSISENHTRGVGSYCGSWRVWAGMVYVIGMFALILKSGTPPGGFLRVEKSPEQLLIDLTTLILLALVLATSLHVLRLNRAGRAARKTFLETFSSERRVSYRHGPDRVFAVLAKNADMMKAIPVWNANGPVEDGSIYRETAGAFIPFDPLTVLERA